jgi:hypothetical protein
MNMKAGMLVAGGLIAGALTLTPAASAQQAPLAAPADSADTVTVTADRDEALQSQRDAERTAADARRGFAGLREGGGDRAAACRDADQADHEYGTAIAEARRVANEATSPIMKTNFDARADGMTERRRALSQINDRVCNGRGVMAGARPPGGGAAVRGGRGPRHR